MPESISIFSSRAHVERIHGAYPQGHLRTMCMSICGPYPCLHILACPGHGPRDTRRPGAQACPRARHRGSARERVRERRLTDAVTATPYESTTQGLGDAATHLELDRPVQHPARARRLHFLAHSEGRRILRLRREPAAGKPVVDVLSVLNQLQLPSPPNTKHSPIASLEILSLLA
jgi:hypothetical protein